MDRWQNPTWRPGYGPLHIAAGVTLVGQEGVVLSGDRDRLEVQTEGVSLDSMHFPQGVEIKSGGSATMTKCTSTGLQITVGDSASRVLEDTRVFGYCGHHGISNGLQCNCGKVQATRCIFEDNSECGVWVNGAKEAHASLYARSYAPIELVDCVIRNNGHPEDAE